MSLIQLHSNNNNAVTCVSNYFIDKFMPEANGEFVKIYLYILKCISSNEPACSISIIADYFQQTENDVLRALKYWEKVKLLRLDYSNNGKDIVGIRLLPVYNKQKESNKNNSASLSNNNESVHMNVGANSLTNATNSTINATNSLNNNVGMNAGVTSTNMVDNSMAVNSMVANNMAANSMAANKANATTKAVPAKRDYTPDEVTHFTEDPDISELFFIVETYMKRQLNSTEINTILYWVDGLKFSTELIVYLVEYCITKDHSSIRYMDKVALAWHERGISTVAMAKHESQSHSKLHYGVMKALGISGRNLVSSENDFIRKWTKSYGYNLPMIEEACRITIKNTHQPSFEYTDSILTRWFKNHVKSLEDIAKFDKAFNRNKKFVSNETNQSNSAQPVKTSTKVNNKFNNFNQRNYDSDKLEQYLLNTTIKSQKK